MNQLPELLITAGPLAGQRFAVTASGLRMGRSSSCEISIKDPALSRNHCLVEVRDDALWITDLASANGTLVNGTELGADSVQLKVGDVIEAGDSATAAAKSKTGKAMWITSAIILGVSIVASIVLLVLGIATGMNALEDVINELIW